MWYILSEMGPYGRILNLDSRNTAAPKGLGSATWVFRYIWRDPECCTYGGWHASGVFMLAGVSWS